MCLGKGFSAVCYSHRVPGHGQDRCGWRAGGRAWKMTTRVGTYTGSMAFKQYLEDVYPGRRSLVLGASNSPCECAFDAKRTHINCTSLTRTSPSAQFEALKHLMRPRAPGAPGRFDSIDSNLKLIAHICRFLLLRFCTGLFLHRPHWGKASSPSFTTSRSGVSTRRLAVGEEEIRDTMPIRRRPRVCRFSSTILV